MSSSYKQSGEEAKQRLVRITTDSLKQQLNRLYQTNHGRLGQLEAFDQLWDLKERALLEGKQSIDVPRNWLELLEVAVDSNTQTASSS